MLCIYMRVPTIGNCSDIMLHFQPATQYNTRKIVLYRNTSSIATVATENMDHFHYNVTLTETEELPTTN